jgi:threonine/homoserine/homoserine lactone efflux protein
MMNELFDGPKNLSGTERAIYMAVGLGIAAAGAKPRPNPLLNIAALAGGAYLAYTGYNGHCPAKALIEGDEVHRRAMDEDLTELGY